MAFSFIRDMDSVINILIFVITAISILFCFRKDGNWDLQKGKKSLRFFTILSNLFCAISALLLVFSSSYWAWALKYIGTVAVTVTFLTVMFFLGPNMGFYADVFRKGFISASMRSPDGHHVILLLGTPV